MQNHLSKHSWLCSSIGRKQLVGITGLGLSLFILTHMAANMLILFSPQAYNEYSHKLVTNPLIYIAEGGLLLAFLAHLLLALRLSWMNWRARDHRYAVMSNGEKRTTWTQRSLWAQGLVILAFLILHLITFKFGTWYTITYDGVEMRDLHRLVLEVFQSPVYVAWYIVCLVVLFFHVNHGVGSSLQTLGVHHPRFQKHIRCASLLYAVIVVGGFLSQPIYVFFIHRG